MSIPSESVVIRAISHETRRDILRLVVNESLTFTELLNYFDMSSAKLTYHLNQVKGFIEKNEETAKYELTTLGKKSLEILEIINKQIDPDTEQAFLKKAFVAQKEASKPLLLQGVNISITVIIFFLVLHILIAVVALPDPQTPIFMTPLMLVIFAGEILILIWLIKIRQASPAFLDKVSKHLSDSD